MQIQTCELRSLRRLCAGFLLTLLVAATGCGKDSSSTAGKATPDAKAAAPSKKSPLVLGREDVLALDAVVEKFQKLVKDADAAGEYDQLPVLRAKLEAVQGALAKAKQRLAIMEWTARENREKKKEAEKQPPP